MPGDAGKTPVVAETCAHDVRPLLLETIVEGAVPHALWAERQLRGEFLAGNVHILQAVVYLGHRRVGCEVGAGCAWATRLLVCLPMQGNSTAIRGEQPQPGL